MPRLTVSVMKGEKRAITRIALVVEAESSPLAAAKRASSWSKRLKAFTTRTPDRYSRMTPFTRSRETCIRR